jgi:hypothetical protein
MKLASLILPVVLALGLSSVYVLPQTGSVAQSAIQMDLPNVLGDWKLKKITPSQAEIDILSKDTQFSKAICYRPSSDEVLTNGESATDRIDVSIVLSGYDLNNSIHRPERCMPSQGHIILSSTTVPLQLSSGRNVTVRRLKSTQTVINRDNRQHDWQLDSITYYYFVGHDRVECDHVKRTLIDMKDRLVRGMDQRWAYVSFSMWYGKLPWLAKDVPESEADAKLREFATEFAESQIDWDKIRR